MKSNMKSNDKRITQFSGDELVKTVSKTNTCPICGQECDNQFEVHTHISTEHPHLLRVWHQ